MIFFLFIIIFLHHVTRYLITFKNIHNLYFVISKVKEIHERKKFFTKKIICKKFNTVSTFMIFIFYFIFLFVRGLGSKNNNNKVNKK